MKLDRSLSRTARLLPLGVLLCFAVFGFIAKTGIRNQEDIRKPEDISQIRARLISDLNVADLPVLNETKAFSITAIEKTPEGLIRIELRNDYGKTIVAYQISFGSATSLVDSFTNAIKAGIEPGEVIVRFEAIDVDPELMRIGFVVRAVAFDDATADGNPRFVREIDEFRLGEMMQTEQFLNLMSNIRNPSGPEGFSQLEEAKASMLALENDKRFSRDLMSGLRNMRLVFSREIDGVRNSAMNDRTRVMRAVTDRYQTKVLGIREYNEKAGKRRIQAR